MPAWQVVAQCVQFVAPDAAELEVTEVVARERLIHAHYNIGVEPVRCSLLPAVLQHFPNVISASGNIVEGVVTIHIREHAGGGSNSGTVVAVANGPVFKTRFALVFLAIAVHILELHARDGAGLLPVHEGVRGRTIAANGELLRVRGVDGVVAMCSFGERVRTRIHGEHFWRAFGNVEVSSVAGDIKARCISNVVALVVAYVFVDSDRGLLLLVRHREFRCLVLHDGYLRASGVHIAVRAVAYEGVVTIRILDDRVGTRRQVAVGCVRAFGNGLLIVTIQQDAEGVRVSNFLAIWIEHVFVHNQVTRIARVGDTAGGCCPSSHVDVVAGRVGLRVAKTRRVCFGSSVLPGGQVREDDEVGVRCWVHVGVILVQVEAECLRLRRAANNNLLHFQAALVDCRGDGIRGVPQFLRGVEAGLVINRPGAALHVLVVGYVYGKAQRARRTCSDSAQVPLDDAVIQRVRRAYWCTGKRCASGDGVFDDYATARAAARAIVVVVQRVRDLRTIGRVIHRRWTVLYHFKVACVGYGNFRFGICRSVESGGVNGVRCTRCRRCINGFLVGHNFPIGACTSRCGDGRHSRTALVRNRNAGVQRAARVVWIV